MQAVTFRDRYFSIQVYWPSAWLSVNLGQYWWERSESWAEPMRGQTRPLLWPHLTLGDSCRKNTVTIADPKNIKTSITLFFINYIKTMYHVNYRKRWKPHKSLCPSIVLAKRLFFAVNHLLFKDIGHNLIFLYRGVL